MFNSIFLIGLGTPELIGILLVVLLLFGGKKIPELMRGLGKGVKEFKDAKDGSTEAAEKEEKSK
ncbi:MAG: hypothetical protein RLZ47_579 [Bacteroidota bacterium]|jgi:sec-independent protein translocase protein TatA